MSAPNPVRKSQRLVWIGALIGVLIFFYFLPLFHLVPLKAAREQTGAAVFNAAKFVETFWNDQLFASAESAVDAGELIAAFKADSSDAAERFGHKLGLSNISSYFVSGRGHIVSVEGSTIEIALRDGDATAVVINTGPIFGNAIRDGSGLLDVSDFSSSREFNSISSEINVRIEEGIFPLLKEKAQVGAAVKFVGGVDISDAETDPVPLRLVPIVIEFP